MNGTGGGDSSLFTKPLGAFSTPYESIAKHGHQSRCSKPHLIRSWESRLGKEKHHQTGACQSLMISRVRDLVIPGYKKQLRNGTFGEKKQGVVRVAFKNFLRVTLN